MLFEHGYADLLSGSGIDGRFVDDDGAALHVLADRLRRAEQRAEVRLVRLVHGRRHGNDDEVRVGQRRRVGADGEQRRRAQVGDAHLAGRIDVAAIVGDLLLRQIETDRAVLLAEFDCERQPDIARPTTATVVIFVDASSS